MNALIGHNGGPPMRSYTIDDLLACARTIFGEARGETRGGQVAVAWVVRNRNADPRWPNSIIEVCKQVKQFSCWNKGNANNHPMLMADFSDPLFCRAFAIAAAVLAGEIADPTLGANHYHTGSMDPFPKWGRENRDKETGRLGAHVFYKL